MMSTTTHTEMLERPTPERATDAVGDGRETGTAAGTETGRLTGVTMTPTRGEVGCPHCGSGNVFSTPLAGADSPYYCGTCDRGFTTGTVANW